MIQSYDRLKMKPLSFGKKEDDFSKMYNVKSIYDNESQYLNR